MDSLWHRSGFGGCNAHFIAEELGRDLSAVSQSVGRLHIRMKVDSDLRQKTEQIDSDLIRFEYVVTGCDSRHISPPD